MSFPPPKLPPPAPGRVLIGLSLTLLLQILAWSRVLHAPFVYDDKLEVVGNRTIRLLDEWQAIGSYNVSRPLLIFSYALNWSSGGLDPVGYHAVSLAIHLLNTVLAFALLRRLLGSPDAALLGAAVWGLHPMTTEAVTYITGRSDALCTTWIFAALIAWHAHIQGNPRARWAALAACVAGLLTKEVAFALPLLLAGMEFCLGRGSWRSRVDLRIHAPVWALGAAALLARTAVYGLPRPEVARPLWLQAATQVEVWARYLQLWLLPAGQSILHDHPAEIGISTALLLAGWIALALGCARMLQKGRPLPMLGLLLWSLTLLPASALPLKETMAEHRAYAGGLGLILGGLSLVPAGALRWLLPLPLVLGAAAMSRNEVWRSEVALWGDAAAKNPSSVDAAYGSADALRLQREWKKAEAGFEEVLRLRPEHVDARVNLGIVLAEQGRYPEAEKRWKEALRYNPRSCAAHNNLGALSVRRGDVVDALREYVSSTQWGPDDRIAHLALGDIFYQVGDSGKAAWHYGRFLEVAPDAREAGRVRDRVRLMGM